MDFAGASLVFACSLFCRLDEHGVAEGEHTVAVLDGVVVRGHDVLAARECAYEHHERALGHMEVRDEPVDYMEGATRQKIEAPPFACGSQALSRLRVDVVPTAMTRPPAACVSLMASTVVCGTV